MSTSMSLERQREQRTILGSSEIRRMLSDYVKRRVPEPDVEDVVQTVLMEALASERVPEDKTELRKWLTGVARHKIADLHRRGGRERPAELPEIETSPAPVEERQLADWAEKQANKTKEGAATLKWMAREGEGDKLEHIAADEKLPAATVRQRVSRMRRWMKERWLAELAAAAAVIALLIFVVVKLMGPRSDEVVHKEPTPQPPVEPTGPSTVPTVQAPSPFERAAELRKQAIGECDTDPRACLEKLDEAKRLDPAGDAAPEVQGARKRAEEKLAPEKAAPPDIEQNKGDPSTSSSAPPITTSRPVVPTAKPPVDTKMFEKAPPPRPTTTTPPKAAPKKFEGDSKPPSPPATTSDFSSSSTPSFSSSPQPQPQQMPPQMTKGGKPSGFESKK